MDPRSQKGLVAMKAHESIKLTPALLLNAYAQGIFPMADTDGAIYWYDPDPRAIIPLDDGFHGPRSLVKRMRRDDYEVRFDYNFPAVMAACAEVGPGGKRRGLTGNLLTVTASCMRPALPTVWRCGRTEAWRAGCMG
jgi:leucyl/phenylalanyl-tRNA--protein transferase